MGDVLLSVDGIPITGKNCMELLSANCTEIDLSVWRDSDDSQCQSSSEVSIRSQRLSFAHQFITLTRKSREQTFGFAADLNEVGNVVITYVAPGSPADLVKLQA